MSLTSGAGVWLEGRAAEWLEGKAIVCGAEAGHENVEVLADGAGGNLQGVIGDRGAWRRKAMVLWCLC
jgi:hypothetical protein